MPETRTRGCSFDRHVTFIAAGVATCPDCKSELQIADERRKCVHGCWLPPGEDRTGNSACSVCRSGTVVAQRRGKAKLPAPIAEDTVRVSSDDPDEDEESDTENEFDIEDEAEDE